MVVSWPTQNKADTVTASYIDISRRMKERDISQLDLGLILVRNQLSQKNLGGYKNMLCSSFVLYFCLMISSSVKSFVFFHRK